MEGDHPLQILLDERVCASMKAHAKVLKASRRFGIKNSYGLDPKVFV